MVDIYSSHQNAVCAQATIMLWTYVNFWNHFILSIKTPLMQQSIPIPQELFLHLTLFFHIACGAYPINRGMLFTSHMPMPNGLQRKSFRITPQGDFLERCTFENLTPWCSKSKVVKVKRNCSLTRCRGDCHDGRWMHAWTTAVGYPV